MSGIERHRQLMRRLRSGEAEAAAATTEIIEGQRAAIKTLEAQLANATTLRETAERQVRDQAREIERLRRELIEARTNPRV